MSRFFLFLVVLALVAALLPAAVALGQEGATLTKEPYGTTADGVEVMQYTMTNAMGTEVKIITYGGTITSIMLPDRQGEMKNVALGFDNLADYETKSPYFGCITGRYANRIAEGKFTLDDVEYQLDVNNGPNHLHGGVKGFDKVVWEVTQEIEGEDGVGIELHYLSPDGDQNYPGALDTYVT
jgi:aldose 1-epimerase